MLQFLPIIINFTGGIISPGNLKEILEVASEANVTDAGFGLRQQLMMNIPSKKYKDFEKKCLEKKILFYKAQNALPNIVSSYCTANIFATDSWLSEGVYKDVFDLFNYQPALKINICDSKQQLIPLFSGHLNWISSNHTHFWHLSLRLPGASAIYHVPDLTYTNDIAKMSVAIEQLVLDNTSIQTGEEIFRMLQQQPGYSSKPASEPVFLPSFHLPYYEGFNKEGEASWLGVYRRDQLFPVNFLKDICNICLETKVGQFYTTAWKSIIIKGIQDRYRNFWDEVLGTHRINVRHAANELNWQVEDNNEDGLVIKRYVIRHFDIEDVRTYGLSFVVKSRPSNGMFGSVVISKQNKRNDSRLKSLDRYEILYTRNFNPNSTDLISFRKGVEKDQLGTYLVSLCKFYYEQIRAEPADRSFNSKSIAASKPDIVLVKPLHQCLRCLSVYDESIGEPERNVLADTVFSNLPADYTCPLCEAGTDMFVAVLAESLTIEKGAII